MRTPGGLWEDHNDGDDFHTPVKKHPELVIDVSSHEDEEKEREERKEKQKSNEAEEEGQAVDCDENEEDNKAAADEKQTADAFKDSFMMIMLTYTCPLYRARLC